LWALAPDRALVVVLVVVLELVLLPRLAGRATLAARAVASIIESEGRRRGRRRRRERKSLLVTGVHPSGGCSLPPAAVRARRAANKPREICGARAGLALVLTSLSPGRSPFHPFAAIRNRQPPAPLDAKHHRHASYTQLARCRSVPCRTTWPHVHGAKETQSSASWFGSTPQASKGSLGAAPPEKR